MSYRRRKAIGKPKIVTDSAATTVDATVCSTGASHSPHSSLSLRYPQLSIINLILMPLRPFGGKKYFYENMSITAPSYIRTAKLIAVSAAANFNSTACSSCASPSPPTPQLSIINLILTPLRLFGGKKYCYKNMSITAPTADGRKEWVENALINPQGPNYALAKCLQEWRAIVERYAACRLHVCPAAYVGWIL